MAKRTAGEANMSDIVGPQHVTKRRKITLLQKQNQNSGHRQWRPMEICCILELVVHPDAEKVYADNPNLDASLLEAQDWNSISRWMTGYFSTAQPFWFSSNSLPKTPYTATECKQLAMNTLCRHHKSIEMNGINQMNAMNKMNGKLPSRFSELSILCNAVRQIYLDHALKILDSRRTAICGQMNQIKTLQNLTPPKSPKLIQLTPSVSAPSTPNGKNPKSPSIRVRAHKSGKPMKSDEEQCRTHLSMVLVKLSEYNQNTRRTMRQKLDQRYKEKFKTILDETSPGPKSAAKEESLKALEKSKEKDWLQYEKTISTKVKGSWEDNLSKLQSKFPKALSAAIVKVQASWKETHPDDEAILKLFTSDKNRVSKTTVVSG